MVDTRRALGIMAEGYFFASSQAPGSPDRCRVIWGCPKIGDPDIIPQIVGSLKNGPQNKVPLFFGNSHMGD